MAAAPGNADPQADAANGPIAAIAVVNGLTLVTSNVRDFRHVEGLRVEN